MPVRVKVGPHRAKPEHDDLRKVAAASGIPVRAVADQVQTLIANHTHTPDRPKDSASPPPEYHHPDRTPVRTTQGKVTEHHVH